MLVHVKWSHSLFIQPGTTNNNILVYLKCTSVCTHIALKSVSVSAVRHSPRASGNDEKFPIVQNVCVCVSRPLSRPTQSQHSVFCHHRLLLCILYLSAVMILLPPIRTAVTLYLASANERLSLHEPHTDLFEFNHFNRSFHFSAVLAYLFLTALDRPYLQNANRQEVTVRK